MRQAEIEPEFEVKDLLPEEVVRELGFRRAQIGFELIEQDLEEIKNG